MLVETVFRVRPHTSNIFKRGAALVACLFVCCVAQVASAQGAPTAEEIPRGRVVETVATLKDPAQTYALYLPSNYSPERRRPVLYCFDPVARGALPVKLYSEAAERLGWVVAGSNNSRNGPLKVSLDAARAMIEDVQARFAVDGARVYTTGFSGGARQAILIDQLCKHCLAGVVAAGAGYPAGSKPTAPVTFALFGVAGTEDFNFAEMKALEAELSRLGAAHRFESFEGGHAWPTPELAAAALEWMELQAMKTGRRERDEAFLTGVWSRRLEAARALEAGSKPYAAYRAYESLAADFRGLRDVSEADGKLNALGASKEVKGALRDEADELTRQRQLVAELFALVDKRRGDYDERAQAGADFRAKAAALRARAQADADSSERRVARRVINQVTARFYEEAGELRRSRARPAEVVEALEIASEVAPRNPRLFYELAVAHAANNDRRKALAALRRAFDLGFKDTAALEKEPALEPLRADAEYKRLVEGMSIK